MIDSVQVVDYKVAPPVLQVQPEVASLRKLALARMCELDDGRVQTIDFVAEMHRIRAALQNK